MQADPQAVALAREFVSARTFAKRRPDRPPAWDELLQIMEAIAESDSQRAGADLCCAIFYECAVIAMGAVAEACIAGPTDASSVLSRVYEKIDHARSIEAA